MRISSDTELVEDINRIALKNLEDRRGRITLKMAARAATKQIAIHKVKNKTARELLNIANIFVERADTRSWRTLPGEIYLGSLFRIAAYAWKTPKGTLLWASFASMLIVVLQGLTDDLVFGPWGAPLVFLVPGISYAMARSSPCFGTLRPSMGLKIRGSIRGSRRRQLMFGTGVLACIALLVVVYVYRQRLVAVWYADLGAVLMARTQLNDFPAGDWDEDYDLAELEPAERLFEGALRQDAWNRTAHHRLGLMAWGRVILISALFIKSTGPSPIQTPRTRDPMKRDRLNWRRNLFRTKIRLSTEKIFTRAGMGKFISPCF